MDESIFREYRNGYLEVDECYTTTDHALKYTLVHLLRRNRKSALKGFMDFVSIKYGIISNEIFGYSAIDGNNTSNELYEFPGFRILHQHMMDQHPLFKFWIQRPDLRRGGILKRYSSERAASTADIMEEEDGKGQYLNGALSDEKDNVLPGVTLCINPTTNPSEQEVQLPLQRIGARQIKKARLSSGTADADAETEDNEEDNMIGEDNFQLDLYKEDAVRYKARVQELKEQLVSERSLVAQRNTDLEQCHALIAELQRELARTKEIAEAGTNDTAPSIRELEHENAALRAYKLEHEETTARWNRTMETVQQVMMATNDPPPAAAPDGTTMMMVVVSGVPDMTLEEYKQEVDALLRRVEEEKDLQKRWKAECERARQETLRHILEKERSEADVCASRSAAAETAKQLQAQIDGLKRQLDDSRASMDALRLRLQDTDTEAQRVRAEQAEALAAEQKKRADVNESFYRLYLDLRQANTELQERYLDLQRRGATRVLSVETSEALRDVTMKHIEEKTQLRFEMERLKKDFEKERDALNAQIFMDDGEPWKDFFRRKYYSLLVCDPDTGEPWVCPYTGEVQPKSAHHEQEKNRALEELADLKQRMPAADLIALHQRVQRKARVFKRKYANARRILVSECYLQLSDGHCDTDKGWSSDSDDDLRRSGPRSRREEEFARIHRDIAVPPGFTARSVGEDED